MGKKKKKGNGWGSGMGWGSEVGGGKNRKQNHSSWDDDYGRKHGNTLSKDRAKQSAKIVRKPAEIPEQFLANQVVCNHADGEITVQEFRAICPSPQVFAPNLERLVARYGEDHVRLCGRCYAPLVDPAMLTPSMVEEAIDVLYAAANAAVSNVGEMAPKEIERLGKARVNLYEAFGRVPAMIQYVNGGGLGGDDDDLNGNPIGSF